MPVTHVTTTVQKFIVVVTPATRVATTVQKFIVVVSAATAVATTVQKFIRPCFANILRTYCEHIANILRTYCEHIANILRTYCEHTSFGNYIDSCFLSKSSDGWVGGWVGIKRVLQLSLILDMLTNKIYWFQKCCQKMSTTFLWVWKCCSKFMDGVDNFQNYCRYVGF